LSRNRSSFVKGHPVRVNVSRVILYEAILYMLYLDKVMLHLFIFYISTRSSCKSSSCTQSCCPRSSRIRLIYTCYFCTRLFYQYVSCCTSRSSCTRLSTQAQSQVILKRSTPRRPILGHPHMIFLNEVILVQNDHSANSHHENCSPVHMSFSTRSSLDIYLDGHLVHGYHQHGHLIEGHPVHPLSCKCTHLSNTVLSGPVNGSPIDDCVPARAVNSNNKCTRHFAITTWFILNLQKRKLSLNWPRMHKKIKSVTYIGL
jgi:hypothetical protein